MIATAVSGCFGGGNGGSSGPEPDPSTFTGETYDRAIGNDGYRIAGDVTAAGTALQTGSAAQLDVVDKVQSDADGAEDLATFIMEARGGEFTVVAQLRQMSTGDVLGQEGDFQGGSGHYVPVFGTTGIGPAELPEATSYLYAAGRAQVRVGEETLPQNLPIFVTVNQGIRDDTGAAQAAADEQDLEMHIFLQATEDAAIPGVPEGFLYYYFETVGMSQLSDDDKAKVGQDLIEPEPPNVPPVPKALILVDGAPAVQTIREGDENLTVTFDASESTDDGEIVVYVWKIFELNRTGAWDKPTEGAPLASGQTVDYNFTAPGPKRIELVIRDDRGAIANVTIPFFIDQNRVYLNPDGNRHLETVSPGPAGCQMDLNCFSHRVSIGSGAQGGTFVFAATQGSATSVTQRLFAPNADPENDEPVAEGNANLDVPGDALQEVGTYTLLVHWQAAYTLQYTITADIVYSPAELPEPGEPLDATASDAGEGEEGSEETPEETP